MMYFVNDNYKTTRPVVSSFNDLMDKDYREHFHCNSFLLIGEFNSYGEAIEAFNSSDDFANNSRYYG